MGKCWIFGSLFIAIGCSSPPIGPVNLNNAEWTLYCESGNVAPCEGEVPGHVLPALTKAGLAPNPYFGTNELNVQWIEEESWRYETTVDARHYHIDSDSAVLHFDGLDTYATVSVNGEVLLKSDNAHRSWTTAPFAISQTPLTVEVLFESTSLRGQAKLDAHGILIPASNEEKPIGLQTSPVTRKPGYQFGWDWGPRLAGPGIVGDVWIQGVDDWKKSNGPNPNCRIHDIKPSLAQVVVEDHENWELELTLNDLDVEFTLKGDTLIIPSPLLWWPVHMGDQPMYQLTWTHQLSGQSHVHRLGLRTAEWRQVQDEWGRSFQLCINDVPVQAKGANLVPPDFHDFQSSESWTDLIQNVMDANMNMVRVWGGGVYPPDLFFDFCDQNGILVWQDFMFACAMIPEDSTFLENVKLEAVQHVQRLRHHPSLVLWCGNNEVERAWESWGWQDMYALHGADSARLASAYNRLFHDVLPQVVSNETDVEYLPTSPTLEERAGDEHAWGVWFGLEDFDYYSSHSGRFASEYGLQSLPQMHTLRDAGIDDFGDEALQFRQRSRMEWLEPGFDGWDMMSHFMEKTTGSPDDNNLEDWIFKSQATQAEGLRQALERHRTSEGRYAGSLYWSLNDVWPAVSWSTVDHSGRWKLGHYAARRANEPRCAIWKRDREDSVAVVVFNEGNTPLNGSLHFAICDFRGDTLFASMSEVNVPKHSSNALTLVHCSDWSDRLNDSYLTWNLTDEHGHQIHHSSALWNAPVKANLVPAEVDWTRTDSGWELVSDTYVPVIQLNQSMPGHWSDNGMALEPHIPLHVTFQPEDDGLEIFDLEIRTLNPVAQ